MPLFLAVFCEYTLLGTRQTQEQLKGTIDMSELPVQNVSSTVVLSKTHKSQGSTITTSGSDSKPKKKICCACPDTKKLRDECIVEHGESACSKWIEAHLQCLRAEGFHI